MRLFGCRKALLLCLNLVCVCAITPSPATAFANEETCKGPCVSQKIGRYFLRLGCFRHFPSTVPQMHLWTRDRHLCDGLSHRQRWTWAPVSTGTTSRRWRGASEILFPHRCRAHVHRCRCDNPSHKCLSRVHKCICGTVLGKCLKHPNRKK